MRRCSPVLVLGALALSAGCIEELDPASLVKKTRPLAAAVSVEGDAAVATPRPGQAVRIDFLVASPGDRPPLSWGVVLCPGTVTSTGEAFCAGEPFAFELQEELVDRSPALDFTVPDGFAAAQVVGLGVVCAGASPVLDPMGQEVGCESGGTETLIRFSVDVLGPDDPPNHNPEVPGAITFDGRPWEPSADELPAEGCADAGAVTVAVDAEEVTIDLDTAGLERERYERFDGEEVREDLVVSHFATAGEFERLLSVVDDTDPTAEVGWTPPTGDEPVASGGERVRFWFVFRDQRGGVSWLVRDACVVP